MNKELIIIPVLVGEYDKDLKIEFQDNCLDFKIGKKVLFSCDYVGNFYEALKRMEKIWKEIGERC